MQPHYWETSDYMNLDGNSFNGRASNDGDTGGREDDQASQIIILKGLPR